jgi:methionine-R-sulfoxide reductase
VSPSSGAVPLSLFHRAFDKLYPLIRFTYERVLRRPWFSRIVPGLWVGGAPSQRRDYGFILQHGIGAIVDVRAERSDDTDFYRAHDIRYVRYIVPDMGVPDEATIDQAVTWIRRQRQDDRSVLIHCAKGRGRSATLAAAYLMCDRSMSYDQARELLVARRSLTKLEDRHRAKVEAWWQARGRAACEESGSEESMDLDKVEPTGSGRDEAASAQQADMPDSYWRDRLTPEQYRVLRQAGTERPFTGAFLHVDKDGVFSCAGCGARLFTTADKYESGCGWPSFSDVASRESVVLLEDRSHGMTRTEVRCARCGGHLGHLFDDGPKPTGRRYCINSAAMQFSPDADEPRRD